MSYNYRCNSKKCRKRITLRKPVEQYVVEKYKKCPVCGSDIHHDPNVKKWNKKNTCHCDGYSFPHMKGAGNCNYVDKFKKALKEDFDLVTVNSNSKIPF